MHTFHTPEPTLHQVHHLAFRTKARQELVAFYTHILGLTICKQSEAGTWLRLGDSVLMLEDAGEEEQTDHFSSQDFVAFSCTPAELPSWVERFEGYGIELEHRTAYTLYVRDPDGRRVGVSAYPL